ncbi:hypothetical protein NUW54_g9278 [Trametes sanguinea]|uniref:Uncharacterized protein n=1 Tax=Trametes sanguinea TaxID=158606 RepID=A0ACC1P9K0_9APHY|nr:hypothetical protein NUW54_g9278 [Trametes sanguinea]
MRLGNTDPQASAANSSANANAQTGQAGSGGGDGNRPSATPTLSASPSKESTNRISPRPPPFTTVPLVSSSSLPNMQHSQSGSWPPQS